MKLTRFRVLLVLMLTFTGASLIVWHFTSGRIEVALIDPLTHQPIRNAVVIDAKDNQVARTDISGIASFNQLIVGRMYQFSSVALDYIGLSINVTAQSEPVKIIMAPAPSRSVTIEPGFSTDCTEYMFVDGTTPVAHPGNSAANIVGTAGEDFGTFINQFLGTSGNYCIESTTNPTYSVTWSITTNNVQIVSQRGNVFTYSGTGTAITASNVQNLFFDNIELSPSASAKVGLELDGVQNSIFNHFQSCPSCAGTFVHDINLNGSTTQCSCFNQFNDLITSFPVFIGAQSGSTQSANFNAFYDARFTAQLVIGNSAISDAPSGNAIFCCGLQTLPVSGTVIPLVNQGTGTGLYNVDCEQNNKCLQNGVVGDAVIAQARVNIIGGYWSGTGGTDNQGFGMVESVGAGIVSVKNMRGTTMALGLPSDVSVTAGGSPWTYTEAGSLPDDLKLDNLNGGSISAWTCNGQAITFAVNSFCILNPGQSMTVTWATTAPSFIKEFFIG